MKSNKRRKGEISTHKTKPCIHLTTKVNRKERRKTNQIT